MLDEAEAFSRSEGFKVINLDVRATQQRAIQRYEAAGYIRFGEHPKYAYINDEYATGYYYYKDIQEKSERTAKHPEKG
jgi:ribosomal protein S18 acetylase RimI-like enzyme